MSGMTKEEALDTLKAMQALQEIYRNELEPPACRSCSNNPKNGGSGICNCILGGIKINV